MVQLSIKILDKDEHVLAESSGEDSVHLIYGEEYSEGDKILLSASKHDIHVIWQVDDALGEAFCFMKKDITYQIPFKTRRLSYSPKTFSGNKHYLFARIAEMSEVNQYRNLAVNVCDQVSIEGCYPHASANIITRGEAVFEVRNVIDGICENHGHGIWPYTSWGINRSPTAEMRIDFGRKVWVDSIKIYLRADFPHDSYWTQGTVCFSDGSVEILNLKKTDQAQVFPIEPRIVEWLSFGNLIKADDESPFPALSQFEAYGKDLISHIYTKEGRLLWELVKNKEMNRK